MERVLAVGWRKQHVTNVVFVENLIRAVLRGVCPHEIQIVFEDAFILEDIHAAVNERLEVGIIPAHVASPEKKIQNVSLGRMGLQVRQDSRRVSFFHRRAHFRLARPVVDHQANDQQHHCNVDFRRVVKRTVKREEIQSLGQHRRGHDAEQNQKSNVGEARVERKKHDQQLSEVPATLTEEGGKHHAEDETQNHFPA